jgi:predicted Zn-dependent protease with MMP-like domain
VWFGNHILTLGWRRPGLGSDPAPKRKLSFDASEVGTAVLSARSSRGYPPAMTDRHARSRRVDHDRRRRPVDGFRATSAGRFERLVADAIASLPADLLRHLDQVHIAVRDIPPAAAAATGDEVPLGQYTGLPRVGDALALDAFPDRLVLYRRPLEARARDRLELVELIRHTVVREVALHLGVDEDRLDELGWD